MSKKSIKKLDRKILLGVRKANVWVTWIDKTKTNQNFVW